MKKRSRRIFMGLFEREEDVIGATRAARERGWRIVDVYAPYPVHGLPEAAGFARSWVPWACLALGLTGAALITWFQFWASAVTWPINVAGKPWNSLPAFIPVTFEVGVLSAGLGTTAVFLLAFGLLPGKTAVTPHPRVTDDRFALLIEEPDATFSAAAAAELCARFNAVETEEFES